MDIVKALTLAHLKASFSTLKLKQKIILIVFLFSLVVSAFPHEAYAASFYNPLPDLPKPLVFDLRDKSFQNYLTALSQKFTSIYQEQKISEEAMRQQRLAIELKKYLEQQRSPLANYSDTLASVKNWKQIVALSNAESGMCKNYPVSKANCWGVGGANLWDMGNSLADGIIVMNKFLNQYPLRSELKYSDMSFKQMNGLYKQPAAQHWVFNAQKVYDDLSQIEKSI